LNHRDAIERLALWAASGADWGVDESLSSHVRGCASCREWIDTYRWLQDGLRENESATKEHPPTEMLALCATRPEELGELDQQDLNEHLRSCAECRQVLELAADAVRAARPRGATGVAESLVPTGAKPFAWSRWVSASVAAAGVVAVVALGVSWHSVPSRSVGLLETSDVGDRRREETDRVAGLQVEGYRLFGSERSLSVSDTQIAAGSQVRFRAGDSVRFGHGFRIRDGGRVAVEATRTPKGWEPP
jgi:predicted anti-sigma-YlaC factor YlaD